MSNDSEQNEMLDSSANNKNKFNQNYSLINKIEGRKSLFDIDKQFNYQKGKFDSYFTQGFDNNSKQIYHKGQQFNPFEFKPNLWNHFECRCNNFTYFVIRIQGKLCPLKVSIQGSGEQPKLPKKYKIFVSEIDEHPTQFNSTNEFQCHNFSIDNGKEKTFTKYKQMYFSMIVYNEDAQIKLFYNFGQNQNGSEKPVVIKQQSVLQKQIQKQKIQSNSLKQIKGEKTEVLAGAFKQIMQKRKNQQKSQTVLSQMKYKESVFQQYTQEFKQKQIEQKQLQLEKSLEEAQLKSNTYFKDQRQKLIEKIKFKKINKTVNDILTLKSINVYRKNAFAIYWLTNIKMVLLMHAIQNKLKKEKSLLRIVRKYILYFKKPFYLYRHTILQDCGESIQKRYIRAAKNALQLRCLIKKKEMKKKAQLLVIDILQNNIDKFRLRQKMISYYTYAEFVKKKLQHITKKIKKFKLMLSLMWNKYHKIALRQILVVNMNMLNQTKRETELSILKEYTDPDLKAHFIDIYCKKSFKKYRDSCQEAFGASKTKFRLAQVFLLGNHNDKNRQILERRHNIINEEDLECKINVKKGMVLKQQLSKKESGISNFLQQPKQKQSRSSFVIQKQLRSAITLQSQESQENVDSDLLNKYQLTMFKFPDFQELRDIIKEAVIMKNSQNKVLATKVTLKEVVDDLF